MTLPLLYETDGPVATITFNRPDRHNALNPEVVCRMDDALAAFEADDALRVCIVTGAGSAAFCAGGDLETMLPLLTGARAPETKWDRRIAADRDTVFRASFKGRPLTKPVIAAINGHCLAGGFELMLGTDIRIAAPHATFGLPEAKLGLMPFAGALARLPRQLPPALAMEMMLTGDSYPAERMAALGLINAVVPAEEVLPRALKIAARIAANGPVAVREIKMAALDAIGRPFDDGFQRETEAMDRVLATEDAVEGPRSFMEKRRPVYRGR
ncbi:enoyl-CoA hydratase/isomerase family protein [Chachezhania sediminis]|uniref:enoyl-CoA hydratase/isomerase family protein n=1 Tax=Chachezhania sediminis TaxID=2599291 RepID=UPI00131E8D18|nr:enoyl-CoA hydratase-related protein [Chachezhania sediminis]